MALVAGVAGDVGGWRLVGDLAQVTARWGLVYGLIGGLFGLLQRRHTAMVVAVWLLLALLGPTSVVPAWTYGLVVLIAAAMALVLGRLRSVSQGLLLGVWAVVVLVVAAPRPSPAAMGRVQSAPHVVLIVVDTLRADRVYPTLTPNISAIGDEGVRFTQAVSTASWTLPAHASLFTGALPSVHGAHAGHPTLDGQLPTLAEDFAARGYRTVGLSANAWVSAGTGLDRGFGRFEFLGDRSLAEQLMVGRWMGREPDLGARRLTHQATAALDQATRDGVPLFLFIIYLEAHEPLGSIPGEDASQGHVWMRDMPKFWCLCDEDAGDLDCVDRRYQADDERVSAVIHRYEQGVAYVDEQVGAIRQALTASGAWNNTWLMVTSDHGEHLGEKGRLGHMVWLSSELEQIPMVVRGPGLAPSIDVRPMSLREVPGWLKAKSQGGEPPPREPWSVAESHPHQPAKLEAWSTVFGCDYLPAAVPRRSASRGPVRVVGEGDTVWVQDGLQRRPATEAERIRVSAPFGAGAGTLPEETAKQLRALGYVE